MRGTHSRGLAWARFLLLGLASLLVWGAGTVARAGVLPEAASLPAVAYPFALGSEPLTVLSRQDRWAFELGPGSAPMAWFAWQQSTPEQLLVQGATGPLVLPLTENPLEGFGEAVAGLASTANDVVAQIRRDGSLTALENLLRDRPALALWARQKMSWALAAHGLAAWLLSLFCFPRLIRAGGEMTRRPGFSLLAMLGVLLLSGGCLWSLWHSGLAIVAAPGLLVFVGLALMTGWAVCACGLLSLFHRSWTPWTAGGAIGPALALVGLLAFIPGARGLAFLLALSWGLGALSLSAFPSEGT